MDYKNEIARLRSEFKNYVEKSNLKSVVLGMSGGADSALVAALVRPVCKELSIPLIASSITIETNKEDEIKRAHDMGTLFADVFYEKDYTSEYLVMKNIMTEDDSVVKTESEYEKKIRYGNIKARMRMMKLYDIAQKNNGMTLSTDNMSEYMLGFWTLNGDVGDYVIVHHLWKSEVFEMMQWIVDNELTDQDKKNALQACIDCVPTDGLGITNSDMAQIGCSDYYECDIILKEYISTGKILNEKVVNRHLNSEFKRNIPIRP